MTSELQLLPSFEKLSRALTSLSEAQADDSLLQMLREFELEVQDLCQRLHAQCLDYLYDQELQFLVSPVLENYQWTYAAIDALREALEDGLPWTPAWNEAQSRLSLALADYPALSDWYQRQPQLSPSPYVHELVRVGRACLQGKLPWECFDGRLVQYQELLQEFCDRYQLEELQAGTWGLSPDQQATLESLVDPLIDCWERLADAEGDPLALEADLENLLEQSAHLLRWQSQLQRDFEQPFTGELACPRCGQTNGKTLRICLRCGARLPQALELMLAAPTVDFRSDPGVAGSPGLVEELVDLLECYSQGELEESVLLAHLASARRKTQLLRHQLGQFRKSSPEGEGQARQLLESGQELLQQAQHSLLDLLEKLSAAVASADLRLLSKLKQQLSLECRATYQRLEETSLQLNQQLHGGH